LQSELERLALILNDVQDYNEGKIQPCFAVQKSVENKIAKMTVTEN